MSDKAEKAKSIVVDNNLQHTINDATYVHWYDSLSNLAFGF